MTELNWIGKALIIFGAIIILVGVAFMFANKLPWIGRLPGDVVIQKKNFTLFFPITTCIIISLVISFIFYIINKR